MFAIQITDLDTNMICFTSIPGMQISDLKVKLLSTCAYANMHCLTEHCWGNYELHGEFYENFLLNNQLVNCPKYIT